MQMLLACLPCPGSRTAKPLTQARKVGAEAVVEGKGAVGLEGFDEAVDHAAVHAGGGACRGANTRCRVLGASLRMRCTLAVQLTCCKCFSDGRTDRKEQHNVQANMGGDKVESAGRGGGACSVQPCSHQAISLAAGERLHAGCCCVLRKHRAHPERRQVQSRHAGDWQEQGRGRAARGAGCKQASRPCCGPVLHASGCRHRVSTKQHEHGGAVKSPRPTHYEEQQKTALMKRMAPTHHARLDHIHGAAADDGKEAGAQARGDVAVHIVLEHAAPGGGKGGGGTQAYIEK